MPEVVTQPISSGKVLAYKHACKLIDETISAVRQKEVDVVRKSFEEQYIPNEETPEYIQPENYDCGG